MNKIPVEIKDFKEMIDNDYYYVDKSMFIKDVLKEKIAFYHYPHGFSQTLNLSMLQYFFSIKEKENAYLFDDLAISKDKEAMKQQNQHPVVYMSFSDMNGSRFAYQVESFVYLLSDAVKLYPELLESNYLSESEKEILRKYISNDVKSVLNGLFNFFQKYSTETFLTDSLYNIVKCLYKHYHQKVIVLIEDYDTPLYYSEINEYSDDMLEIINPLFNTLLEYNEMVEKCLFMGNLIMDDDLFLEVDYNSYTICDFPFSSFFGFSDNEVKEILEYYDLEERRDIIKEWYGGYFYGNENIYDPSQVMKYIDNVFNDSTSIDLDLKPLNYIYYTRDESFVQNYISYDETNTNKELEKLINGRSVIKKVYFKSYFSGYSILTIIGYLKISKVIDKDNGIYELKIPNKDKKRIFQIISRNCFKDYIEDKVDYLIEEFLQEKIYEAIKQLMKFLSHTIIDYEYTFLSYCYILEDLFENYDIKMDFSKDNDYIYITVMIKDSEKPIILDCIISKSVDDLIDDSLKAVKHMKDNHYKEDFKDKTQKDALAYGISLYQHKCFIRK